VDNEDGVRPEDSVSQTAGSSNVSGSVTMKRLQLNAQKAAILAEAVLINERQQLGT